MNKILKLQTEICRELYFARKMLNGQKGQRKDPAADDYIRFTWADFCEYIGISRSVANNRLKNFIPAELSESGKDILTNVKQL